MDYDKIILCIFALILGMLVIHMFSNVCGCKSIVEGQTCEGTLNQPAASLLYGGDMGTGPRLITSCDKADREFAVCQFYERAGCNWQAPGRATPGQVSAAVHSTRTGWNLQDGTPYTVSGQASTASELNLRYNTVITSIFLFSNLIEDLKEEIVQHLNDSYYDNGEKKKIIIKMFFRLEDRVTEDNQLVLDPQFGQAYYTLKRQLDAGPPAEPSVDMWSPILNNYLVFHFDTDPPWLFIKQDPENRIQSGEDILKCLVPRPEACVEWAEEHPVSDSRCVRCHEVVPHRGRCCMGLNIRDRGRDGEPDRMCVPPSPPPCCTGSDRMGCEQHLNRGDCTARDGGQNCSWNCQ